MRPKYLYRATAFYSDNTFITRHYQSLQAARAWCLQRLAGYEAEYWGDDGRDGIAPASSVLIEKSNQITFPEVLEYTKL